MSCDPSRIRRALYARGVRGDALLNALDLAGELEEKGGEVGCDGMVKLYHRTSRANAERIVLQQAMYGKEDGLFFSTKATGDYIEAFGPAVVVTWLPLEKLELNDVYSDQAHVRLPTGVIGRRIPVKVALG